MDKLKALEESDLGKKLDQLKELHTAYNKAVAKQNLLVDVMERINRNQFDRQIVEFTKAISSSGVTDGEWKTVLIIGVEETIKRVENQVSNIARNINEIVRVK